MMRFHVSDHEPGVQPRDSVEGAVEHHVPPRLDAIDRQAALQPLLGRQVERLTDEVLARERLQHGETQRHDGLGVPQQRQRVRGRLAEVERGVDEHALGGHPGIHRPRGAVAQRPQGIGDDTERLWRVGDADRIGARRQPAGVRHDVAGTAQVSLTSSMPASCAASRATSARQVSRLRTRSGCRSRAFARNGTTRSISSRAVTTGPSCPARTPPTSTMSAPRATASSRASSAESRSACRLPDQKESGVRLTMAITAG